MKPRIDYAKGAPGAVTAMRGLETYVRKCGLEGSLLELVRLRASQINGCAYCVDMHTKDARAEGETEQRLYAVATWEETPIYEQAYRSFGEKELIDLTLAIIVINGWNRLAISFRTVPGTYQPATKNPLRTGAQDSRAQKRRARSR